MKTKAEFEIDFVYLAYVPPFDKEDNSVILETKQLKKESKTTDYLFKIFDNSIDEAKIEISFNSDENQNNEIRNNILAIALAKTPNSKFNNANKISNKLYTVTDARNGTGLFVIIEGKKGRSTRIVLMRFKGVEGLVTHGKKFSLDYISEVFTKKSTQYKLTVYEDIVSNKSFWRGWSIDKQISSTVYKSVSYFWVESFLDSKTALTPEQGTMQFSKVIRKILSTTTDVSEQEEIISGIINLRSKRGMQISISSFCETYLSENIANKIKAETLNDDFYNSVFTISSDVYRKEFGKTVLSLTDGITAFIPTFKYENHVTETLNTDGSKTITIEGKLTSKKIHVQSKKNEK